MRGKSLQSIQPLGPLPPPTIGQYLSLRDVGAVCTVLKKLQELRPGLQAFFSKNGS